MAVRRESVRLDVEGNFAQKMLEDATAVAALKRSLKDLSGTSVQTSRSTQGLQRDIENTGQSAKKAEKELDSYTGRLGFLASAIAAVAPAAVPIGAVGVAGLAGVANDAGMAATAVGSLLLALHGVMPALKAVNKAALEPTAANLQAASLAMQQLSPDARRFVVELQSMEPLLHSIQASAASGWFPGLTQALEHLRPLAPTISKIFHDVGTVGGNLAAKGAAALAGPQWRDFFKFVDTEAPKALAAMGHVLGSLTHGLSQLWMAFSPLNNGFNNWLVGVAKGFDSWATGLSQTQGFQDFIAYIDQNGPKVAAAVKAIANAVIQIVQAAAPLGGPTLDAITALANALAAIANSPLGTPIMLLLQMAGVARLAGGAIGGLAKAYKDLFIAETEAGAAGKGGIKGAAGPAAAAALLGGTTATAGFDALGNALSPGQKDLGTPNNIAAIVGSIHHSTGFQGVLGGYLADPAKLVGFNPDHIGDKGPYQQADAGLAQLVASGNGQKAAAIFAKINAQVADAPKYFPAYESSLKGVGSATASAANKTAALRAANKQTADSFVNLADDMKKPTLSLDNLVARWRSQAAAEAALGKNIATAIAKGANPEALSKVIDQLGPQAGLAIQQLARGGKKGIADLNAAFHTGQHAANTYNNSLNTLRTSMLGLPHNVTATVKLDGVDRAISGIATLRQRLSNPIVQSVQVQYHGKNVTVNPTAGGPGLNPLLPGGKHADGGLIVGPGGPRDDRILARLSNKEYVMPADAVEHYGVGFMDMLRARRFANGGYAGSSSTSTPRSGALAGLDHHLRGLNASLAAATAAVNKEKAARDSLVSKMSTLSDSVTTGLRSDLFGTVNPWQSQFGGSSGGSVMSTLQGDIANARKEQGAIAMLKKKGVTGDALAEILAQGGLAGALEFASLPASELAAYQRSFNLRQRLTAADGRAAGIAAYGSAVSADNKQLRSLNATVRRLEAEVKRANKQAHADRKHHTDSQKKGASSAGRRNGRRPKP